MNLDVAPRTKAAYGRLLMSDLVSLCRPKQWTKNIFVLAPLIFSGYVTEPVAYRCAVPAMICFCLWSSAVYCLNDVLDAAADRQHPRKRVRPVASGRVSASAALILMAVFVLAGLASATAVLPTSFLLVGVLYLANSLLYCVLLKYRVIVDVLSIAIGFDLRLVAGCAAIGVTPTSWILICGFSLAMLLGFGKRRLEIDGMDDPMAYRCSLQSYSPEKLNILLGITASTCLLSYMLYSVSPDTIRLHQTSRLIYTVPFVAYGIFRYIFKVQEGRHDGPVEVLAHDPVFAVNGLLWSIVVIAVLYVAKPLWPEAQ